LAVLLAKPVLKAAFCRGTSRAPFKGIADRAQDRSLALVRIGQHRQRLFAVRGGEDVTIRAGLAMAVMHDNAILRPLD
jgi:hypothetical protein